MLAVVDEELKMCHPPPPPQIETTAITLVWMNENHQTSLGKVLNSPDAAINLSLFKMCEVCE